MRFSKRTSDQFFTITVESDPSIEMDDDEPFPTSSLEALILELEILAAELRNLISDDGSQKRAN